MSPNVAKCRQMSPNVAKCRRSGRSGRRSGRSGRRSAEAPSRSAAVDAHAVCRRFSGFLGVSRDLSGFPGFGPALARLWPGSTFAGFRRVSPGLRRVCAPFPSSSSSSFSFTYKPKCACIGEIPMGNRPQNAQSSNFSQEFDDRVRGPREGGARPFWNSKFMKNRESAKEFHQKSQKCDRVF